MYVYLANSEGDELYSTVPENLTPSFESCNVQNETFIVNGKKYRHGKISNQEGEVYLVVEEPDIIKRPRLFKEKLKVYLDFIPTISKIENRLKAKAETHNRRVLHNLSTLNGHNIQEIFNIIPEQDLRTKREDRKKFIKKKIVDEIEKVPTMIMNIMKNNVAIKMEFALAGELYGATQKLKKQSHVVRRALMNILHVFFQDFNDRGIHVEVEDCDVEMMLSYESFQLAIYQLFDNATKYALSNSDIRVSFFNDSNSFCLAIDMISLKIEEDELEKLTIENFCGRQAKKIKRNGKGIGMYIVKKVLALSGAKIEIIPVNNKQVMLNGIEYADNRFVIKFPKGLVIKYS